MKRLILTLVVASALCLSGTVFAKGPHAEGGEKETAGKSSQGTGPGCDVNRLAVKGKRDGDTHHKKKKMAPPKKDQPPASPPCGGHGHAYGHDHGGMNILTLSRDQKVYGFDGSTARITQSGRRDILVKCECMGKKKCDLRHEGPTLKCKGFLKVEALEEKSYTKAATRNDDNKSASDTEDDGDKSGGGKTEEEKAKTKAASR